MRMSPSVTNNNPGVEPVISRRADYIESAPLADVMFDQLQYLLAHKKSECSAKCEDCARLDRVKTWLMLPFRGAPAL
jgi:hypothetical protein